MIVVKCCYTFFANIALVQIKLLMKMNRICELFDIQYPIIQGGMVWCSGWRLASAVSNAGGLGLIGAGSMHPDVLRDHIRKCQAATDKPFGVNVPLMYPEIDALMNILVEENVKIVTELSKSLNEICPQVPLYLKNNVRAYAKGLEGFTMSPTGGMYIEDLSWSE